jgi:hypothetical protein
MTSRRLLPGTHLSDDVQSWFSDALLRTSDVWQTAPDLLDAGMEDMRSPYLVLAFAGHPLLLLERRNDDGEWAPLFYCFPSGLPIDLAGRPPVVEDVFAAMSWIGEYAQELTGEELRELGVVTWEAVTSGRLDDAVSDLLYGYRDFVNPHALD